MIDAFSTVTLLQLVEIYLSDLNMNAELINITRAYYKVQQIRGTTMARMLYNRYQETLFEGQSDGNISHAALDLGCGSGAAFGFLSMCFQQVVGIDINRFQLILAKKYIEESGLTNVMLVCGQGDCLPFPADTFDYASALNVLEHVFKIDKVAAEVYRVLHPSGGFAGDSRNRYDILTPEPHTNLRLVGFLPRHIAPRYVKWRTNREYNDTWLLSYGDLQSAFKRHFGANTRILFPHVAAYGYPAKIDTIIQLVERLGPFATAALHVFPSHLVVARR